MAEAKGASFSESLRILKRAGSWMGFGVVILIPILLFQLGFECTALSAAGMRRALHDPPRVTRGAVCGVHLPRVSTAPEYDAVPERFEVVAADAAARLLRTHGFPEGVVRDAWMTMALHTSPGIAEVSFGSWTGHYGGRWLILSRDCVGRCGRSGLP